MTSSTKAPVLVVGTGLAGLTTAHQLLNKGMKVILLEKTGVVGFSSNSNKASSGINGVPTLQQLNEGLLGDSIEAFINDSIRSAKDGSQPHLILELTGRSLLAIEWLTETFDIDLSKVSQLGGHSYPRTHRGSGLLPPGYAIISSLVKTLQPYEQTNQLKILKHAKASKLLTDRNNKILGLEYEDISQSFGSPKYSTLKSDKVVLATGGYSADFISQATKISLLQKYRPDLLDYPSTNGVQTTGDGIKILLELGAQSVDMDKIQIHPTGFVDPQDKSNKWKFLAGEVLRGNGGILLDPTGQRFVNELETRDHVTGAVERQMSKYPGQFTTLVLPEGCYDNLKSHLDFYLGKKLLKRLTILQLAENLNVSLERLQLQLNSYNTGALNSQDEFGRSSFGPLFGTDAHSEVFAGAVTPVLHFSMGGLKIDNKSRVLGPEDEIIEGLYAVGEVSGGVHGFNRLGGSSLLECVVFGTIASEVIAAQL